MKFVTPILSGVVGAAQLSTAGYILRPSSGTDFLLSGGVSSGFVWVIPLGALLGFTLGLLFLWPGRPKAWREWWNAYWLATLIGFFCAPFAPGFLGLGPHTPAQLWQGFTFLYSVAWVFLCITAQLERRGVL